MRWPSWTPSPQPEDARADQALPVSFEAPMAQFSPDDIANQRFRSSFRGYDPSEVGRYLASLAEAVAELASERDRLQARLVEMGERDLKREFEAVGREVADVLESARDAAYQMRERASADATRWRSEAVAEAEALLRRARADAEQLRSDAWSTGDELLKQAVAESERITGTTEKERLRMVGEAERESHRLVAAARRESEELMRSARMEADRLLTRAQEDHDQIIQQANRAAEAAQERTRALELRREELRGELDEIRHALATVEGELEDRRAALALSPSVDEVPDSESPADRSEGDSTEWSPGETVRVVRPSTASDSPESPTIVSPEMPEITVLTADELARRAAEQAEAEAVPGQPLDVFEPGADDGSVEEGEEPTVDEEANGEPESIPVQDDGSGTAPDEDDGAEEAPTLSGPDEARDAVQAEDTAADAAQIDHVELVEQPTDERSDDEPADDEPAAADDESGRSFAELSGLFERLRGPGEQATVETTGEDDGDETDTGSESKETAAEETPRPSVRYTDDVFELKSRLLMPITNRALRNIKRQLTEAQNEALEELRLTDGAWEPDGPALGARLRPDLTVLSSESFAAGHAAAVEMSGERLKRPSTPKSEAENDWVSALIRDLNTILGEGRRQGQGSRELGASVSRVFRSWRTDEAERRVSDVAAQAYHTALSEVLLASGYSVEWVVAGRGCPTCRTNAEALPSDWTSVPPAHGGCGCTLVIV